jgi:hypothetical protein
MNLPMLTSSLPGIAAVITALAALVTALGSIRAGRIKDEQLKAKDEQLKARDARIVHLQQLTPERLGQEIGGFKAYYHALLDQRKDELDRAELALHTLQQSKAATDAQFGTLRKEREELEATVSELRSQLTVAEQAGAALDAVGTWEAVMRQLGEPGRRSRPEVAYKQPFLEYELEKVVTGAFEAEGYTVAQVPAEDEYRGANLILSKDGCTTVVKILGPASVLDSATIGSLIDAERALSAQKSIVVSYGLLPIGSRMLAGDSGVHILTREELHALLHFPRHI